jgi:Protein of unknwon function (DUF3310)
MEALNNQAGGNHYRKMKIQPIEYIVANNIDFLAGNIIKYASRHASKGGAEDIRKIKHYCDLILEFVYGANSAVQSDNQPTQAPNPTYGQISYQYPQLDSIQGVRPLWQALSDRGQEPRQERPVQGLGERHTRGEG